MGDVTKVIIQNPDGSQEAGVTPGVAPPAGTPALVVWDMSGGGGGGGGDGAVLDGVNPAIRATVFDYTNSNPQAVQLVDSNGNPLAGSAVSIADGADVAEGATTDAAVVTDAAGTVSGKLRGLVKWAFERMPASLGGKSAPASLPVIEASNLVSGTIAGNGQIVGFTAGCAGMGEWAVYISPVASSLVGTLQFEATYDNVDWFNVYMEDVGGVSINQGSYALNYQKFVGTTTSLWRGNMLGYIAVRVRCSAYTSGSSTIFVSTNSPMVNPGTTRVIQGDRNPNAPGSNGWPMLIFDNAAAAIGQCAKVTANALDVNPTLANSADPTFVNGDIKKVSVDLAGNIRTRMNSWLGSLAPTVGQKAMAASIPVVLPSDQTSIPVSFPPIVSATGVLSGAGQTVTLALAQNVGAGVEIVFAAFTGQIRQFASFDGGVTFDVIGWAEARTGIPINTTRTYTAETSTQFFVMRVPSGATHVRTECPVFTGGTATVLISGTNVHYLQTLGMGFENDTSPILQAIQLGGAASTGGQFSPVRVTTGAPGVSDNGLVVRNRSATAAIQAGPVTANDGLGNALALHEQDGGQVQEPILRKSAPASNDPGVVVRGVDAATQTTVAAVLTAETDIVATGSIAALGANLVIDVQGRTTLSVNVTGVFDGTCQIQATLDEVTWVTKWNQAEVNETNNIRPLASDFVGPGDSPGEFFVAVTGYKKARVIFTIYNSGTLNLILRASNRVIGILDQLVTTLGFSLPLDLGALPVASFDCSQWSGQWVPQQARLHNTDFAPSSLLGKIVASFLWGYDESTDSFVRLRATIADGLFVKLTNSPTALVSAGRESYVSGDSQPLSLTSDGRLRVSTSPSDNNLNFFEMGPLAPDDAPYSDIQSPFTFGGF